MLNLNIQFQSIYLSKEIINENDTIRVSITTYPDGQKQAQTVEVKKMNVIQPTFKIKMNNQTEKIIVVFRKQGFFTDDHIIASTVLHSKNIHIFKELINNEHQKVSIYEPIQGKNNNKSNNSKNRRVVGSMEIEFTMHEEFSRQNFPINKENQKEFKRKGYSQVDALLLNQSNRNQDFMFQDLIYN